MGGTVHFTVQIHSFNPTPLLCIIRTLLSTLQASANDARVLRRLGRKARLIWPPELTCSWLWTLTSDNESA
jgi:hypothetical protein